MDEIKDVIAGLIQNYEVIRDSEAVSYTHLEVSTDTAQSR